LLDDMLWCAVEQNSSKWKAEQAGSQHFDKLRGAYSFVHQNPWGDPCALPCNFKTFSSWKWSGLNN
jgi:hypothetical protein